jgi:hypothetical protein
MCALLGLQLQRGVQLSWYSLHCFLRTVQVTRHLVVDARDPHSIAAEVPTMLVGLDLLKFALSAALFLDMRAEVASHLFARGGVGWRGVARGGFRVA